MSSWRPNDDETESEDENEFEYDSEYSGKEAIIFLIDAFLSKTPDRFQKCLNIIRKALLNGLFIRDKDLIGIVFYNTEHKPNPKDIEGIKNIVIKENTAVLLPLRQLTKDIISYYMDFAAKDTDHFDFNNIYGCKMGSFVNAIWLCTNMFKQCGTKLMTSTIIMFTDLDIPPDVENNNNEFQKAIKKATDLNEIEIDFNVIPMKNDFDYEKFYKEFLCTVQDIELDEFIIPNPKDERKFVSERQLKQNFKKQCTAHLRWTLNDNLEISVSMYNYYRKNVRPKSVKLLREDNSIVDVKRVMKIQSIGDREDFEERTCRPGDERKVIKVGNQDIIFTSDELAKMRSPLTPRLTLIGFKSRNIISINNFIKSTSFLYPDEKVIEGSTKLFRTLWEKCLEKKKIAFCVLVSRRKTIPRYVALVPTSSKSNETTSSSVVATTDHIEKDGFKIVYLPFEIDYRDIDLNDWDLSSNIVNVRHVELFKKIVKKLKFKFSPTIIYDPLLEKLCKDIRNLALDLETENVNNDDDDDDDDGDIRRITFDPDEQNSRIQAILPDLKDMFGEDLIEAKKRRANDGPEDGTRQQKTQKVCDESITEKQILRMIAANNLDELTVKQLKTYLQSKNVKGISSATKTALIEKIRELHT